MVQIPQTTYNEKPPVAFAGMLADSGNHDIETGLAQTALDAGLGVVKGTTTPQVKLPGQASDVTNLFRGVTQYLAAREPIAGSSSRYAATDAVPVVTQGRVWVQIDATNGATMADEGPVYCVHSGAQAGKFRGDNGDAGSGATATIVAGAKCKIGGTAGGVAQIKVNLP